MTPKNNELLFCALGGSGEIGMNVNLYGHAGKWVMVDCGVTFADAGFPGIDVILPDLRFIEEQIDNLVGLVLTHGHEDHIGALPYLAEDLGVPLYATPFTAGLIRGKLEEERIQDRVKIKLVDANKPFDVGPFKFTMVPLAHSIPEANGLVIETKAARVFHTGDWKLDAAPVIGTPASPEQLTAIATGSEAPWRGRRMTRTSWQKYLPPNCAPTPICWVSLSSRLGALITSSRSCTRSKVVSDGTTTVRTPRRENSRGVLVLIPMS